VTVRALLHRRVLLLEPLLDIQIGRVPAVPEQALLLLSPDSLWINDLAVLTQTQNPDAVPQRQLDDGFVRMLAAVHQE
jgi:hypothetical protein